MGSLFNGNAISHEGADGIGPAPMEGVQIRDGSREVVRSGVDRPQHYLILQDDIAKEFGWIGFDPTHNSLAGERHIRVAVGRDYSDVPPTRGVFKGLSAVRSELMVGVSIGTAQHFADPTTFTPWMSREASSPLAESDSQHQQQQ